MKFFVKTKLSFWAKIFYGKKTCVYQIKFEAIAFYKNGILNNTKNAAIIYRNNLKSFYIDGVLFSANNKFTKQSWRKFVKLKAFL
jgi:hypothetical protein